jgi:hypothetical protein
LIKNFKNVLKEKQKKEKLKKKTDNKKNLKDKRFTQRTTSKSRDSVATGHAIITSTMGANLKRFKNMNNKLLSLTKKE